MRYALRGSLAFALCGGLGACDRSLKRCGSSNDKWRILLHSSHLDAGNKLNVKVRGETPMGKSEIAPEDREFFAFVVEHFDVAYYLESNSDVARAEVDPLEHWLNHGVREERQISTSIVLRYGKIAIRSSNRNWKHYRWRGDDIAMRLIKPIPAQVISQIFNQGRHDPAVLAAGANTIETLSQLDREDVHLDVAGLQREIPHGAEFLLIVPNLIMSEDRRFTTDLIAALGDAGFRSIQKIVTDRDSAEARDELRARAPFRTGPFRTSNILFWRDFWVQGPEALKVVQLAQLIRVLRPRVTIIAGSRHGYEIVARFGHALSECTKIYCIYTGAAQGRDFAARFARRTLPFATALTDDVVLAARLREQYGDLLGHDVAVLPTRVVPIPDETFKKRLRARRQRNVSAARPLSWAWVGRITHSKAIQILTRLANRRRDDRFELFGAVEGSLDALGLAQSNIILRHALEDFARADFSSHSGFLFTSLSQGAPIIALEMSQHAIPLVLSKEAGLPETFDEQAAFFIEPGNEDEIATGFSFALDRVSGLTDSSIATMMMSARDQALKRHSPAAFVGAVTALFGRP